MPQVRPYLSKELYVRYIQEADRVGGEAKLMKLMFSIYLEFVGELKPNLVIIDELLKEAETNRF